MCATSVLVGTSCRPGVQENGAIGLIVFKCAENEGYHPMFRNTFPMRDY